MSLFDELTWRGLVAQATDPRLSTMLSGKGLTFYCGFDPSAPSLHVGSLVPVLAMARLQRAGHRPIALVGGATGMIGDPSFKSEERKLLDTDAVHENARGIRGVLERFLDFDSGASGAMMVNNHDWLGRFGFLEFLRDVGKHFTVNNMLGKESVRARLDDRDHGISFTEFSYMLLQAYDFLHLFDSHNCTLQVGGSDQWGNITAGIELIRRQRQREAFGLTFPLLLTSSGHKFGKTERGAVWLDSERTSDFDFYQFWVRAADADVVGYLKLFTFLEREEIAALATEVEQRPGERLAQLRLAEEVTRLVRGDDALSIARKATAVLYGQPIEKLSDAQLAAIFPDVGATTLARERLRGSGLSAIDAFSESGLAKSKGQARRLLAQGGAYVNNRRVAGPDQTLTERDLASETILVLRSGKKNYHLLRFD